jgi:hypothetical protein
VSDNRQPVNDKQTLVIFGESTLQVSSVDGCCATTTAEAGAKASAQYLASPG